MIVIGDDVTFETTGNKIYANKGIIGLSKTMGPTEGYDGDIDTLCLTKEEKFELANYMVNLWSEYRTKEEVICESCKEVDRLQCIIREFCAGQEFADKLWKEQKHIKTLFEEAGQM